MARGRSLLTGVALLAVAGCVTNQYAVYKHPVTGDVMECEQPIGETRYSGDNVYAVCKTSLEQQGYVRAGTVKRAPTATSLSEAAKPRPAPR
jgi:hypothetical protein